MTTEDNIAYAEFFNILIYRVHIFKRLLLLIAHSSIVLDHYTVWHTCYAQGIT